MCENSSTENEEVGLIPYEARTYRGRMVPEGLQGFNVNMEETDLMVFADGDYRPYVAERVRFYRDQLKGIQNPAFFTSLIPIEDDLHYPPIARHMIQASAACGVGPMAAVAGAIAEYVGLDLLNLSSEVIVENGGDIFLRIRRARKIGIYAGLSPLSNRLSLEIDAEETPMGICTSSGTVGHSLSFGKADAVVTLAKDTPLADAAATAIANLVRTKEDIERAITAAQRIPGVTGVVIIIGEHLGVWGQVRLCRRTRPAPTE